ncbi:hypothetical protein ymoll0001_38360 [Yersinia mollaretii ATCC 43969]|uniref:Uncharacterized protein n=1 Tax=Yersinia mollaretii (strain ATCC 43969 / DSM 18520 / CIP 103324 / CNY 7263 / WAIP 204) TaxID=349967 RepID=A0ABP2EB60_YERMW|nr:hypothetical protein ymoll0001_38360 [Yersinia mollaretii ATCC 43969]
MIRRLWYNSISNPVNNRWLLYQRLLVINRVVSGGTGLDSDTA